MYIHVYSYININDEIARLKLLFMPFLIHSFTCIVDYVVKVMSYIVTNTYLARLLANAESDTCGPHIGKIPLQRVLAFCNVALSHSSRPRANLK